MTTTHPRPPSAETGNWGRWGDADEGAYDASGAPAGLGTNDPIAIG